jgi:hypothetical protein
MTTPAPRTESAVEAAREWAKLFSAWPQAGLRKGSTVPLTLGECADIGNMLTRMAERIEELEANAVKPVDRRTVPPRENIYATWRCFYCDEVFKYAEAVKHFADESPEKLPLPACRVAAKRIEADAALLERCREALEDAEHQFATYSDHDSREQAGKWAATRDALLAAIAARKEPK